MCVHTVCIKQVIMEDKDLVILSETSGFGRAELLFCLAGFAEWSHSQAPNRMLSLSSLLSPSSLHPPQHNGTRQKGLGSSLKGREGVNWVKVKSGGGTEDPKKGFMLIDQ